jgi:hypothetical protein
MNTTPADEILALWVEDELHGPERAEVDTWALSQPEWLAHREDARRVRSLLQSVLPAAEEPPYADFFNARIAREIATVDGHAPQRRTGKSANWLTWFMPTAAAAGMALCFWAGTHVSTGATASAVHHPATTLAAAEPFLYTPESGIKAAWYGASDSGGALIVLDGVDAIPDSFEIPETASIDQPPSSTAENDRAEQ